MKSKHYEGNSMGAKQMLGRVLTAASLSKARAGIENGVHAALVVLLLCGSITTMAAQVVLEFDYPTNELPGMTFRAYSTNDVNAPVITWPLLAAFVGTNRVLVTLPQGINFAVVQASNSLGTSFFSAAAMGILPRTNVVPRFVKP